MSEYHLCRSIAVEAHGDDRRRDGRRYIEHPMRVADTLTGETARCIAVLHDVIEDTDETRDSLISKGVSPTVADAVRILTHKDSERYEEYIRRVCMYAGLAKVKLADMLDNLCDKPTDRQREKYRYAAPLLLEVV